MSTPTTKPRWTDREIRLLAKIYPRANTRSLLVKLPRHSEKAIGMQASRLGLRKSKARLRKMGQENVAGRWGNLKKGA